MMISQSKKKNINIIIVCLLAILFALFVSSAFKPLFETKTTQPDSTGAYLLKPGEVLRQELSLPETNSINSISLRIGTHNRSNSGTLHVVLFENDVVLYSWEIDTSGFVDNAYQSFKLDSPLRIDSDSNYSIEVYEMYESENYISIWTSSGGDGLSSNDVNSVTSNTTLCYQITCFNSVGYKVSVSVICLLFVILTALFVLKNDMANISLTKITMVLISGMLLIYMFSTEVFCNINRELVLCDYQTEFGTSVIHAGDTREYSFHTYRGKFDAVSFQVESDGDVNLNVQIFETADGNKIFDGHVDNEYLVYDLTNSMSTVRIELQELADKGMYSVHITNSGSEDIAVGTIIQDDNGINCRLIRYTNVGNWIVLIVMALLFAYLVLIVVNVQRNSLDIQRFFLITVVLIGAVYLVLMTPWSAPDSGLHYRAIYRFSNILLGQSGDKWIYRVDDRNYYYYVIRHGMDTGTRGYADLIYNFNLFSKSNVLVYAPYEADSMKFHSIFNYFPQIFGLTLGRIFNLSAISCVYLARISIFAFYVWACLHAIKTTPIGKSLFALIPLLPMSLMMSSALSYDTMVLIATLNFTASTLNLYKNPDSKKSLVETMIWCFLLGSVKGGGFLIMLPIILICLCGGKEKKGNWKRVLLIAASGLFAVIFFNVIMQIGNSYFQFGVDGNGFYKASYAITNPAQYLQMTLSTYINKGDWLILSMLGGHLCWLEAVIPEYIIVFLVLPLVMYALVERDRITFQRKDIIILLIPVIVSIVTTPAMLLSWTKLGSNLIDGLQGRYYLPVLVLLLLAATKNSFCKTIISTAHEDKVKNASFVAFAACTCLTVFFMAKLFLCR